MLVVKIGGGEGIDIDNVLRNLVDYEDYLIIHGGSAELNEISRKLEHPPRFVKSVSGFTSRYTDKKTLEIFEMVYSGKKNVEIVEKMQKLGINALGLTGVDGRLLEGRRKSAIKIVENEKKKVLRDDYTGVVEKVNLDLIKLLMRKNYVPVITFPAISYESEAINVDGDRVAAVVASELNADTLVILSNVPGLLRDVDDENSLIEMIPKHEIDNFMDYAKGRMKKKVMGAKEALKRGVSKVIFASANVEKPITNALNGRGTVVQ